MPKSKITATYEEAADLLLILANRSHEAAGITQAMAQEMAANALRDLARQIAKAQHMPEDFPRITLSDTHLSATKSA